MVFCPNCGHPLQEGATRCDKCGTDLTQPPTVDDDTRFVYDRTDPGARQGRVYVDDIPRQKAYEGDPVRGMSTHDPSDRGPARDDPTIGAFDTPVRKPIKDETQYRYTQQRQIEDERHHGRRNPVVIAGIVVLVLLGVLGGSMLSWFFLNKDDASTTSSVETMNVVSTDSESASDSEPEPVSEERDSVTVPSNAVAYTTYDGHTYALFEYNADWNGARDTCQGFGGHLVTITSDKEQKVIEEMLDSGSRNCYWIGALLSANNDWIWVNGEPFTYENWAEDTPDNFKPDGYEYDYSLLENVAIIYRVRNPEAEKHVKGMWNDLSDDGECFGEPFFGLPNIGFICEWD